MGLYKYVCAGCGKEMDCPFSTGRVEHSYYDLYDEYPKTEKLLLYHLCQRCKGQLKIHLSFADKNLESFTKEYHCVWKNQDDAT